MTDQECRAIKLVNDIEFNCIAETDESIRYDFQIDLNDEVFTSAIGIESLSDATKIENFAMSEATSQIAGEFLAYDKAMPTFKASVRFIDSESDTLIEPIIKQVATCDSLSVRGSQSGTADAFSGGNKEISVYPNPSDGRFIVKVEQPLEEVKIRGIDLLGRTVYLREFDQIGQFTWIDISGLPSGTYVLNLGHSDGYYSKTLIKQ